MQFTNDCYGKYECFVDPSLNATKASVIFPATQKHIRKYEGCPTFTVVETADLYEVC